MNVFDTLLETSIAPEKWMVGILVSFWDGLFSGAMLVLGSVHLTSPEVLSLWFQEVL